ncbi:DMT family transporter [Halalkalibacter sp. APA_J-10(15)]|uniref:DMT family transporter n=1 Tax=Halalkalibacter sp. APA_J-10(15) TaxID=2933805 RepID=UPI001FF2B7B6|nr:DMT family transporter [Halalkalibacter sp. APA_J-10(15)]MCK0471759.1 DMT family transporter [Halalkalibacter sp. APA_J-10(15)]
MRRAYFKMILAMFLAGSSVVTNKVLVENVPVFVASELRFLMATMILVPFLFVYEEVTKVCKKELFILFLQALTGVFLFSICMLYGLKYTTALEGGIITSTLPAVTAVCAFFIIREKPSFKVLIGIGLTMIGLACIQTAGVSQVGRGLAPLIGNGFIFCAVISEALFVLLGKISSKRHSPLVIATFVSAIGSILFLPFAIYELRLFSFRELSLIDFGIIVHHGLFVTVVAFILMYQAVREIPANQAGVLTGVVPLSAATLSFIFLREPFSFGHLVGMILVLLAVCLIAYGKNRKIEHHA